MTLTLRRFLTGSQGTLGIITGGGREICRTLELPWRDNRRGVSCIVPGLYRVFYLPVSAGGKFRDVYHVDRVPGRDGILIHGGNLAGEVPDYVSDSWGCILPCLRHGVLGKQTAGLMSSAALGRLHEAVKPVYPAARSVFLGAGAMKMLEFWKENKTRAHELAVRAQDREDMKLEAELGIQRITAQSAADMKRLEAETKAELEKTEAEAQKEQAAGGNKCGQGGVHPASGRAGMDTGNDGVYRYAAGYYPPAADMVYGVGVGGILLQRKPERGHVAFYDRDGGGGEAVSEYITVAGIINLAGMFGGLIVFGITLTKTLSVKIDERLEPVKEKIKEHGKAIEDLRTRTEHHALSSVKEYATKADVNNALHRLRDDLRSDIAEIKKMKLRLAVLQALNFSPVTEFPENYLCDMLEHYAALEPCAANIREALDYCAQTGLVSLDKKYGWSARISARGVDFLDVMKVSSVSLLPDDIKLWINSELQKKSFSDYDALTDALNEKLAEAGLEVSISRSALSRWGVKVKERVQNIKNSVLLAEAMVNELGDEGGRLAEGASKLIQNGVFEALALLSGEDFAADPAKAMHLAKTLKDLAGTDIQIKKHAEELRRKQIDRLKTMQRDEPEDKKDVYRKIMREVYGMDSRFKIGMYARQTGKSFSTAFEIVKDCVACELEGIKTRWRQAGEVMTDGIKVHLKAFKTAFEETESWEDFAGVRVKQLEIIFPGGSRITALPASPDTARGFSANVFWDEAAFHADSRGIWQALFPVISAGRKIRVMSTPNGKGNKFYELMTAGGDVWSRHKCDIYDAVKQGLDRDPELLRAGLADEDAWRQEFMLEWLDEASAWLSYDLISACESPDAGRPAKYEGGPCYIGVDIAVRNDLFCAAVLEQCGDVLWVRELITGRRLSFDAQHKEIDRLFRTYKVIRMCVDRTGMGEPETEYYTRKYGVSRTEGVIFTAANKHTMALNGKQIFEDRKIRIAQGDQALRDDLHSLTKTTGPTGAVRFGAERTGGSHADRTWAVFLAVNAAAKGKTVYAYDEVETGKKDYALYDFAGIAYDAPTAARGISPNELAEALESAHLNDTGTLHRIIRELPENEPHYRALLQTRILSFLGLPVRAEAAGNDEVSVRAADAVRELCASAFFTELRQQMSDAVAHGIAVSEIVWETSGGRWMPKAAYSIPQWNLHYEPNNDRVYIITAPGEYSEIPDGGGYIIHRPQLFPGSPVLTGTGRVCAALYLLKASALQNWAFFCEAYGLPMTVGKYDTAAGEAEKAVLKKAVQSARRALGAVIPDTMKIEYVMPVKAPGDVFSAFCRYIDENISKAVLGQTMTADTGGSLAQAEVHDRVRNDYLRADGAAFAASLMRYVIRPFVRYNFGAIKPPAVIIEPPEPEDTAALADMLVKLVPMGLRVEESVVRDKFGLPEPEEGSAVLKSTFNTHLNAFNNHLTGLPGTADATLTGRTVSDGIAGAGDYAQLLKAFQEADFTDDFYPRGMIPGFPVISDAEVFFAEKKLRPGFNWRDVFREEHAAAFTVAKMMQADLLADTHALIREALRLGMPFAEFKKKAAALFEARGWTGFKEMTDPRTGKTVRAELGTPRRIKQIYETNMRTARAGGEWKRIEQSRDTLPYLLYLLGPSKEHREMHVRYAGTLLPADHPWWRTHFPPNGWGCKCRVRQVSRPEYEKMTAPGYRDASVRLIKTEPPAEELKEYINERTGRRTKVPEGIDPGFDYNPGEVSAFSRRQQEFADKLGALTAEERVRLLGGYIAALMPYAKDARPARLLTGIKENAAVWLSGDTLAKQLFVHPELTDAEYALLAEATENAEITGDKTKIDFEKNGRKYAAVLKKTEEGFFVKKLKDGMCTAGQPLPQYWRA
ncbi:hypothetical protein CHS0354_006812 [Potamilus streckersoni]|uniref:DUF935 family protein n=1 Tax=Potamilus streckersoni TaxID=2493646 RepID=A0AAE0TEH9_9BIVA|nr:hypothetical protein CHS0354_006812 [Potamilus streckersoni]